MKQNGAGTTDSQTRAERIHETVRERILTNRYPPGTTLREGELAEEFGVSRSPIRRAFARLEEARLLEIRHGVGALVTEIQTEDFFAAYDVRMLLLAQSGPYFVSPFPADAPAFFAECRDRFLSLEEGDVIGFAQVNNVYFIGALNLIRNEYLRDIQIRLFYDTARMWNVKLPEIDWAETVSDVIRDIDSVIHAIKGQDTVGLAFVLRNSLWTAKARFNQTLENSASAPPWHPPTWSDQAPPDD